MEVSHQYRNDEVNQYKNRLSIALKAAKICVFEVDLTQQLYTFFENAEDIFGVYGEDILRDVQPYSKLGQKEYQKAVSDYFSHPDDEEVIDEAFISIYHGHPATYTARMKAGDSNYIWCKLDIIPLMENNKPVKMIGVITDISNLKRKTDLLEEKVKLDNFTGLCNKEYTTQSIKYILDHSEQRQQALLFLDIDNFKHFNDTCGHLEGDRVIKGTADLLMNSFRKTDIIGRFGGDEFIVLVRDIPSIPWLRERVQALVDVRGETYYSTNSIGVAVYPDDGTAFNLLLKRADQALYFSKKTKKSCTFFLDLVG